MARPLNKKYFGEPTAGGDEIKVQFHNGTASVPGWIVKQLGAKKFLCSDGVATAICYLTDAAAGSLTAGQMSITVNDQGTDFRVVKIAGHKITTNDGRSMKWDFTGADTATVEVEEAGDDAALTNADNFEGDVE